MWATKPTPQASCSRVGSYRPDAQAASTSSGEVPEPEELLWLMASPTPTDAQLQEYRSAAFRRGASIVVRGGEEDSFKSTCVERPPSPAGRCRSPGLLTARLASEERMSDANTGCSIKSQRRIADRPCPEMQTQNTKCDCVAVLSIVALASRRAHRFMHL